MAKKNFHVSPNKSRDGWTVKREGSNGYLSQHSSKRDAVDAGRNIAKRGAGGNLIVHGRDGKISERHSYGNESRPPRAASKKKGGGKWTDDSGPEVR